VACIIVTYLSALS